jgi:hypothetical protein
MKREAPVNLNATLAERSGSINQIEERIFEHLDLGVGDKTLVRHSSVSGYKPTRDAF